MTEPDDRLLTQITASELERLVRRIVREELDRAGHVGDHALKTPPLGSADLHAAAKHFKTSYSEVRAWIVDADAPAVEVECNRAGHRQWRVDLSEVAAWIAGGGVGALERKRAARAHTTEATYKVIAEQDARARRKGYVSWADERDSKRRVSEQRRTERNSW